MEQKEDIKMMGQPRLSCEESSTSITESDESQETEEEKREFMESMKVTILQMIPLIRSLGLENKTPEEIREALHVDFSTLPVGIPTDNEMRTKLLLNMMVCQLKSENIRKTAETFHPSDRAKYDLNRYNNGIVALGVENFMVAATQFCEDEAAGGEIEIVSVGSGDGTIEKDIMAEYRARFRKDLPRIKLVDPDPKFDGIVDFKTVDHLIDERPNMVGNCVTFIIWPLPVGKELTVVEGLTAAYDIEAIRKLQPKAVFIVYECMGGSGSNSLRNFLRDDELETLFPEERGYQNWLSRFHRVEKTTWGLDNYSIIEVAHRKIRTPRAGTSILRMVKLKRIDEDSSSGF